MTTGTVARCLFPNRYKRSWSQTYPLSHTKVASFSLLSFCDYQQYVTQFYSNIQAYKFMFLDVASEVSVFLFAGVRRGMVYAVASSGLLAHLWGNCSLNTKRETLSKLITITSPVTFQPKSREIFSPSPTLTSESHVTLWIVGKHVSARQDWFGSPQFKTPKPFLLFV